MGCFYWCLLTKFDWLFKVTTFLRRTSLVFVKKTPKTLPPFDRILKLSLEKMHITWWEAGKVIWSLLYIQCFRNDSSTFIDILLLFNLRDVNLIYFRISEFVIAQSAGILRYAQKFIFKSRIGIFQSQFSFYIWSVLKPWQFTWWHCWQLHRCGIVTRCLFLWDLKNTRGEYFLSHVVKSRALSFQVSEDPKQVNILKIVLNFSCRFIFQCFSSDGKLYS